MEVSVLNIKGQETGKKVALNDAIFGIEPNDHVIYLDVKQYMANQRQGTRFPALPVSWDARKAAAVLVTAISTHPCCVVVAACLVPHPVTTASS